MSNAFVQVALTYIRRPFSSIVYGTATITWLLSTTLALVPFVLSCRQEPNDRSLFAGACLLLGVAFGGMFIAITIHIKQQFANCRARLMPEFGRVHGALAGGVGFLVVIILPAMVSLLSGLRPLGLVTAAVLLFASMFWLVVHKTAWFDLLIPIAWFVVITPTPTQPWMLQIIRGQHEFQALALLTLGLMAIRHAGRRLVGLTEDSPDYHPRVHRIGDNRHWPAYYSDIQLFPRFNDWQADKAVASLTQHVQRSPHSTWSRICRWQAGLLAGWALWRCVIFLLFTVLIVDSLGTWLPTRPSAATGTADFLRGFLMLVPIGAAIPLASFRRFKLPCESLLPVERTQYIRQIGAAAALSQIQLWGMMMIALAIWGWSTGKLPLFSRQYAGAVAVSAACQIVVFSCVVWTARYRDLFVNGIVFVVIYSTGGVLQLVWPQARPDQLPLSVFVNAGIAIVVGVVIVFDAYRRWLVTDFD